MDTIDPHVWLSAHGDYLYRFALARLRDPHQAEDAVQDTFLAAMQNPNFAGQSSPRTWLTGILKHKIIDSLRKQVREQPVEHLGEETEYDAFDQPGMDDYFESSGHWSDKPSAITAPDGELQQKQFLSILQTCMERLPAKLAALFMLRDVQEEDNEIICKELQITPTNAWVMLYRARMGLRKCLEIHWLGVQ